MIPGFPPHPVIPCNRRMKKRILLALSIVPFFLAAPLHADSATGDKGKVAASAAHAYTLDLPKGLTTRKVGIGIVDVLSKRKDTVLSQKAGKIQAKIGGVAKLDCSGDVTITFDNLHLVITDHSTDAKGHPTSAGAWIEPLQKELLREMTNISITGSE